MNIEAMNLREDFYGICEKTLNGYFKEVYGEEIVCSFRKSNFSDNIVVYEKINVIGTRIPGLRTVKYLLDEFNIKDNYLKFILAKIYVILTFFSFGIIANRTLLVKNKEIFTRDLLIFPANRKLRIFHFNNNYVDAVVKDTFTRKFFQNELDFRLNSKYEFVPPIEKYGNNWYREKILEGQALARIRDKKMYSVYTLKAIEYISIIANETLTLTDNREYSSSLFKEIKAKLMIAKENKKIKKYKIALEFAEIAFDKSQKNIFPVPICLTHGDLQTGNIWIDHKYNKVILIDWETNEKRSIWYDPATLLLSLRRKDKLRDMVLNCDSSEIKDAILMNDKNKNYDIQSVIGILFLENIIFYLDDMLELPSDYGGEIFDNFVSEMDKTGWRIKK